MNNKLGQNMMTADKVRELLNKANIPTTPTYMGPSLPQAPKGNKLGKAASSIGKGIIGTLPILTQTAVQSGKDLIQQQGDTDFRTARMNQAIAQTNPALTEARFNQSRYGTPLPINQNLQSATQSLKDAQINTPIDLNSMGGKLMQGSIQDWEYATKDLSGGQRFLADTGRSILENAVTLPLALVNPSLPLAAMGARATASKAYDLSQQGVGASEALSRGLVSGGIEALTEKIPLENVLKLGKEGSKQIIKSLLKQSGIEATEESASYALNYLADKAYKDPNATFSIKELAMSAAGGALSGGVMGGGAMAFNKVANRQPSLPQAPQSQPSQPIPNLLQLPPPRWYVNPDGNIANDPSKTFQTATPTQVSVKTEPTMKMLPAPRMYVDPDGEASYNLTKPEQQVNANPDLHIDKRTNLDAKDNKVNAFQYDNPQIKPFYQEQANYLLSDLQNGVKGKRFVSEDGTWTGQKRLNSEPIEKLLNSGLNYEQIEKGLMRIIQDAGKENTVTAKRIEFAIDEALSKGYLSLNGDIPANDAYVIAKSEIPGASGNHIFTDDEINLIQQQQRNPDYKVRHGRQVIDGYVKPEPITPYEPPTPDYKVRYGRQAIQTPDQQATAIQTNTPSEPVLPRNPQKVNKPSLAKNKAVVEPTITTGLQVFSETGEIGEQSSYIDKVNKYGAIPKGEKPVRDIDVPKQTKYDNRTNRFVRTALEAEATPDAMVVPIKDAIEKDAFAYEPIKDAKAMNYATSTIKDKGYNGALAQWQGLVESNSFPSKEAVVLGEMLYKEAAQAGDTKTAMRTLAEVAALGTRLGQAVQALRLLKKMTPEGQLYYIQKSIDHINEDIKRRHKGKAKTVKISDQLADEFLKAETQEAREVVADKINKDVGEQVPVTWLDKWNAWRYLSMLGNPRTHVRNIVGNTIFIPARKLKNLMGVGIERVKLPQNQRTKAILTPKDKGLVEFAKKDFAKNADTITRGGKYNPADAIRENRKIFDNKILEFIRRINFSALEKEDIFFLRNAYANSLAGWMKAQGKAADTISNADLERARNYATQEALKATYRDASAVATWMNRGTGKNALANVLIEGVMPFKKTPINILKRGVEYSPFGVFKSIYDMNKTVKDGNMTASEAIDEMAAGLSGTAIFALGSYLASQGLISGGGEDEKRESNFDKLQGVQNYALKIGDVSYTIDWMSPVALPLFVGVELYNSLTEENKTSGFTEFVDSALKITEPMFNLSMLQGFNSTIQSAVYAKRNPLSDMGMNIATNYIGQANPTLLGQIARTIDDTRRNAYYNDKTVDLPQVAQIALKRNQAKIPFASQYLPAYVDQWGREEKEPNIAKRAIENAFSPGYISEDKSTPVDKELKKIYDRTGEVSILPNTAPKYFNVGEKRVDLNAKQYVKYAKEKGQKSYEYVNSLIKNNDFKLLSDENKVKIIGDAYSIANSLAKSKVSLYKPDSTAQKALQATRAGVSMGEYLIIKNTANLDGQGSIRQEELQARLEKTKLTKEQKSAVWQTFNSSWKFNPYE